VFDQATQRAPTHRRTWVVLVDGARHQLDLIRAEAARRGVHLHVLVDFIHVLEYVWKAAWCSYHDADPAAEPSRRRPRRAHPGRRGRRRHRRPRPTGHRRRPHRPPARRRRCLHRLPHRQAGAAGLPHRPGPWLADRHRRDRRACRHLVGDRLDTTGARWGLHGAEAVLKLRAPWTNGDLDAYWRFHPAREHRRVLQARYQQPPARAA